MKQLVTVALVALVHTAVAATLETPFMVNPPGSRLHCDLTNVSPSTITVKIELVAGDGTVVISQSGAVRPGAVASRIGTCSPNATGTPPGCGGYCRFSAPRRSQVRGVLLITPGDSQAPIVALPAQ